MSRSLSKPIQNYNIPKMLECNQLTKRKDFLGLTIQLKSQPPRKAEDNSTS